MKNTIRIVTSRTTGITHLMADQGAESLSSLVARNHPVSTLCGRKVEGIRGYFDAKHDGTVQFGAKGDCVRCTTQGRAREVLPTPKVKPLPRESLGDSCGTCHQSANEVHDHGVDGIVYHEGCIPSVSPDQLALEV